MTHIERCGIIPPIFIKNKGNTLAQALFTFLLMDAKKIAMVICENRPWPDALRLSKLLIDRSDVLVIGNWGQRALNPFEVHSDIKNGVDFREKYRMNQDDALEYFRSRQGNI